MSIIISGMEMPKCCADCDLLYDYMGCSVTGTYADFAKMDSERLPNCPLKDLKRPQGKWIEFDDGSVACPFCKTGTSIKSTPSVIFFNYCPICGAKMRKGGAEE